MRCLSIAVQLRKLGADVIFAVADSRPSTIIEESGFRTYNLGSIWNNMDTEIETFCRFICDNQIEIVLIDSYFVTKNYLEQITKYVRVCYIDDLDMFIYPVDLIVNYSLSWDREYENRYRIAGLSTSFLLGGAYVPLREEFAFEKYQINPQVKKVLITTGGTDQLGMSLKFIHKLLSNSKLIELQYHIIVGRFNQHKNELIQLSENNANIIIHENVNNISYYMRNCDVAISAAGTTTFELAACGIPSICFEVADNQEGANLWEEMGYMFYAGNAIINQEECINNCILSLQKMCEDFEIRKQMSRKMQSLVDGLGSFRIAKTLIELNEVD